MKTNPPLAVWSLVLGIVSIICCGPIAGIPAIICGHMARSRIKMEPDSLTGDGMAMAGLIMGYFSIIIFILAFFIGLILALMVPSVIHMFRDMPQGPVQAACSFLINMLSSLA